MQGNIMQRLTIIFLTSLIGICILPSIVLTQERTSKPLPRQFDEYNEYDESRITRFARQLKKGYADSNRGLMIISPALLMYPSFPF
jgi:hypothetical protein